MIDYIKGDVTKAPEKIILQGCNAQGKMNSGVAKAIRNKWPEVFAAYNFEADTNGLVLGEIYPVFTFPTKLSEKRKIIVNGITQRFYGRDPKTRYVDYEAIQTVCNATRIMMDDYMISTIAMPKIGAGLGNGDWKIIEDIINQELKWVSVKVYVQ